MNTQHSKWNGLAVICIIGLITVSAVAAKITAPFFHITADNDLNTIISGGMLGLLGLLKSAAPASDSNAGTTENPVKTELIQTPGNPVEVHEAGTP